MTNEEALERLVDYFEYEDGLSADKDMQEAYKIARKALKAEPNSCEYWDSESRFCALRRPQVEPTIEQVEEYCRKRCLVVVDGALFNEMKSRWSAEPTKHGRWKDGKCSKCGHHAPFWAMASTYYRSRYCPNCGADMRGGENE